MTNRTGGGANSRVVSNVNAPKREPRPYAISVGATSRLGGMVGEGTPHKALYSGAGYSTPIGPSDNMAAGPGANRMVMHAGSQSPTPAARPMSPSTRKF
jgi:hypothetical protein